MKAQIKALDQASKNAQDGASLIKTAEGYMGEIHDMLNRVVELAEKSANGTYETQKNEDYTNAATDRQAIQDEVDQLTTEIDRIAKTANFNQLKLLDGSLDSSSTTTSTTPAETTYSYVETTKPTATTTYSASDYTAASSLTAFDSSKTYYTEADGVYTEVSDTTGTPDESTTYYTRTGTGTQTYAADAFTDLYIDEEGTTAATASNIATAEHVYKKTANAADGGDDTATTSTGKALKLQIGETSGAADKLEVSIMNFQTSSLLNGLKTTQVGEGDDAIDIVVKNESDAAKTAGIDGLTFNVSNQDAASVVAEKVRDIINKVSSQRATLGAMENRLDYTMNNLDTASQNITDANSRIRDTDMAKTMMQYTQGNTLTQAAQAMLAQANQAPSQVLQLLQ
jgi:flagellin